MDRVCCLMMLLWLGSACLSETATRPEGKAAQRQDDDPPLTHSWEMPEGASKVAHGDVGTDPEPLAGALMKEAPGAVHRTARHCTSEGALEDVAIAAIRFEVGADGSVSRVTAEPEGKAGDCLSARFAEEWKAPGPLSAGRALVRFDLQ